MISIGAVLLAAFMVSPGAADDSDQTTIGTDNLEESPVPGVSDLPPGPPVLGPRHAASGLTMADARRQMLAIATEIDTRKHPPVNWEHWADEYEMCTINLERFTGPWIEPRKVKLNSVIDIKTTHVFEIMRPGLFFGRNPTGLFIIYRQFCPARDRMVNSVVADYWFLDHLKGSGLVPQVFQVSAPLNVATVNAIKGGKIMIEKCTVNPPTFPEIRYIVMENVDGGTLNEFVENPSIADVANIGIEMISALRGLHERNVVHGDAHLGNFLFNRTSGKFMKFIDFERARVFNPVEYQESVCIIERGDEHLAYFFWHSPWEAMRCVVSFRDDVYRVLITMALLLYGEDYQKYFYGLTNINLMGKQLTFDKEHEKIMQEAWKNHRFQGHIFEVPISDELKRVMFWARPFRLTATFSGTLSTDAINLLVPQFNALERHIISLQSPTDGPDYEFLIRTLETIRTIAPNPVGGKPN